MDLFVQNTYCAGSTNTWQDFHLKTTQNAGIFHIYITYTGSEYTLDVKCNSFFKSDLNFSQQNLLYHLQHN